MLVWVAVVFIAILVHELGHALAFRRFGLSSQIILHFAGGLTVPEATLWGSRWANVALGPNQNIFISLAGPGAGFLTAALIIAIVFALGGSVGIDWLFGFIPLPVIARLPFGGWILGSLLATLLGVNVFWGLINLVPVYPLDGGSVTRNVLLQVDPIDGIRKSLWISVIVGALIALAALLSVQIFLAILFGLLAFQSYQSLQGRF
jgi:Zn-dependent protease